jgi:hypothetical protein
MAKGYQKHMERKKALAGMRVVGIDPASRKHQATVLDEKGIQQGHSFSFPVSHEGYEVKLWKGLTKILGSYGPENLVFAIETSCALWKTLTRLPVEQRIHCSSRQSINHLPFPAVDES